MNDGFEAFLKEIGATINAKLEEYINRQESERYIGKLLGRSGYKFDFEAFKKSIIEPAWYLVGIGGKRWRPAMMYLVIEALGKDPNDYVEFLLIPEVIHNATLIHDDIEDNSDMRRGQPAVHKKYGLDIANNLGDFMYFFPIVAMVDSTRLPKETKDRMLEVYVREMLRVCAGQSIDIAWHNHLVDPYKITDDMYLEMVYDKSGVLASMAAKLGAIIAGADDQTVNQLGHLAGVIGVAFQIQDDYLNIYPSKLAESKGGVGDDISEGKITLLVTHTINKATKEDRDRLIAILKMHTKEKKLIDEAISIIDRYGAKDYCRQVQEKLVKEAWSAIDKKLLPSKAKERLGELTEFLSTRSY
jgi:geranylgeranyl pyrophosphate synthase